MGKSWINWIGSGLRRNFIVLVSSSLFAQLITFALSPLLSRMYNPEQFGALGLFQSVGLIVVAVNTLQLSQAIVLPKKDIDARALVLLSFILIIFFSFGVILLQLIIPRYYEKITGLCPDAFHIVLFAIYSLTSGMFVVQTSWSIKRGKFRQNSISTIIKSASAAILQYLLGRISPTTDMIILGYVIGSIIPVIYLLYVQRDDFNDLLRISIRSRIRIVWREYYHFPLYSTPQTLINTFAQGLPVFILQGFFGLNISGQFSFSRRILNVPYNMISSAFRQLLLKEMSDFHKNKGKIYPIFIKYTKVLFAIAVGPALIGVVIMPELFSFIFGENWRIAGEYSRWIIVWMLFGLCNIPSVIASRIVRKQHYLLIFEIAMLLFRSAALLVGCIWFNSLISVILFSVVGALGNIVLVVVFLFILKYDKTVTMNIDVLPETEQIS